MKSKHYYFRLLICLFFTCSFYSCDMLLEEETDLKTDCETYETAKVRFENKSNSNTTYDIIWNGSRIATVAPGQSTNYHTVSASQHTLTFKISNSSYRACNTSTPTLSKCSHHTYSCTY